MRSLLISSAILAAIGTAAMAQGGAIQPNPNGAAPPATEQTPNAATPSPAPTSGATSDQAAPSPGAADATGAVNPPAAPNASGAASNTTAQDTATAPAAAESSTQPQVRNDYPVCKSRAQDSCRVPRSGY